MDIALTDPVFTAKDGYNALDRFFLKYIRDERDLPFVHLSLRILLLVVPLSIFLFFRFTWWLAVPLLAFNVATGLGPYVLMLHNTSHRRLFKAEYEFMNNFIPWVLGPFYGETPETYFGHHVMMHHPENNLIEDLSCTMKYRRDNLLHFLKYFSIFFFFGLVDLSFYFKRKNRRKFIRKILTGEIGFFAACAALWTVNWQATLMVFVLPFLIARFAMMAGNWAQHAFVDAAEPDNNYKNSITCINCAYNKNCFNDGYHIGHHLRPTLHWTDMPEDFRRNVDKYRENDAIVFQGLDFFAVWFFLMMKNYKALAKRFVDLRPVPRSEDEVIALLKSRTARIAT